MVLVKYLSSLWHKKLIANYIQDINLDIIIIHFTRLSIKY